MTVKQLVSCCSTTKPFRSLFNVNQFMIVFSDTHHRSHHHEHPAQ